MLFAGIEATFGGDYDRADALFVRLAELKPAHPAADFYRASVLFWRHNEDASNPDADAAITSHLQHCMSKGRALLDLDPEHIDALHYLGLCATYLGRLDAHRGRMVAGGSQGEKGRRWLERAIKLCARPGADRISELGTRPCADLAFPYGAYGYYAGRLPRFLRALDFLWFVPSGSCVEGLRELERARRDSDLHRLGATSLLVNIYSMFEPGQGSRALELSRQLLERFPDNPFLDVEHAAVLNRLGRHDQAEGWAQGVLAKARQGRRGYSIVIALSAELEVAEADLARLRLGAAERRLQRLSADVRLQNNTQTPRIWLLFGMLADARGRRDEALRWYEQVDAAAGRVWNRPAIKRARRYREAAFVPGAPELQAPHSTSPAR